MSQIEKVLNLSLPAYSTLSPPSKAQLCSSILKYTFRAISATELATSLRGINSDFSPKKVRLALLNNGSILKNVKLFTYASASYKGVPSHIFDISPRDEKIILHRLHNDYMFHKFLRGLLRQGYKPLTPKKMDRLVQDVVAGPEFTSYIGKFVNKKLSFIVKSTGIKPADMTQDLCSWGTYALYRAYPRMESFLHAINIAKQAAHNRGINLIMENTSQSRERFSKNSDGTFSSVNVPLHTMLTPNGTNQPLTQCNHLIVNLTGASAESMHVGNVQNAMELKLSIKIIYSKLPPRLQHLMRLWAGKHDVIFSEFLGEDNDEVYDQMNRKEYMLKCVEFLKVPERVAKDFYHTLRRQFKDYK